MRQHEREDDRLCQFYRRVIYARVPADRVFAQQRGKPDEAEEKQHELFLPRQQPLAESQPTPVHGHPDARHDGQRERIAYLKRAKRGRPPLSLRTDNVVRDVSQQPDQGYKQRRHSNRKRSRQTAACEHPSESPRTAPVSHGRYGPQGHVDALPFPIRAANWLAARSQVNSRTTRALPAAPIRRAKVGF